MATKKNKYTDYKYVITTPEELREAKWLIEVEKDFKDMNEYIDTLTKAEIRRMKYEDSLKKKKAA